MSPYSPIAEEYYDAARHPTCANFDELSRRYLEPRIGRFRMSDVPIVEVGCGRSLVAQVTSTWSKRLDNIVLLDASPEMLEHSRDWKALGAKFVVADAKDTQLPGGSFELLVSSLGDPYNTIEFWSEVHRLLKPGGRCLFTTPSSEWADRFRADDHRSEAEFLLADGRLVLVPSYTPPLANQIAMIQQAGLRVEETVSYFIRDIGGYVSPKLRAAGDDAVLYGLTTRK